MTTTLHIEHKTTDFDGWKALFDSDPVNREASGVRHYRILRSTDDPNYVMIDLDFDTTGEAEAVLANLRKMWAGPGGKVTADQTARIAETVETRDYPHS